MGNVEIKLHTFITSASDGCCCPALHSLHLYSWAEKCFGQDEYKNSDMHTSTRRGYTIHRQSQNLKYEMVTVIPSFVLFLPNSLTPTTYKLIYAEIRREVMCGKTYNS
jgi:hypothetical protein